MEIKPGLSALITGAASGIGKALSLALGEKGVFVTVVDLLEERGKEVASLIQKQNAKFHTNLEFPSAMFIRCEVTNTRDLGAAFEKHVATYGGLDICINSAGIATAIPFYKDQTGHGTRSWRQIIDVNLIAVIDCTRLAINAMKTAKKPGVIINLASGAGLYPMFVNPVYSASKGGVVMFTRSLLQYKSKGIRINALCPDFVETEMGLQASAKYVDMMGGFIPMQMVIKGAFELISDEKRAGCCLWMSNKRGLVYWPSPEEEEKYLVGSSSSTSRSKTLSLVHIQLPQSFEKIVVHSTLTHNFGDATSIVRAPLRLPIGTHQVLVKVIYAGVNASDVNFSSGRYLSGIEKDMGSRLPFDAGFEAVGIVAALGESVHDLKVGTPAAIMAFGGYAEYIVVPAKDILPVPRPDPEVVAMLTSGLTASIALEKAGQMESGKVVLVTDAAGVDGQFAVQLAKLAGNTVVATCGGNKEKAVLLKELGVHRVIDFKAENIKTVLKMEFPKGIDIIYESVGGDMFDLCLNALAVHGRLVVIGMISQPSSYTGLYEKILSKSQTLAGFFLIQYAHLWQQHLDRLFDFFSKGKLKVFIDPKRFVGVHSITKAVEYLHSGKSVGKVIVCIDPTFSEQMAKL